MFSAVNDTLLPVRSRRGRDDRAAGEKKLRVGDEAGRPSNADRAQGRTQGGAATGTSCAEAGSNSKLRVGEPAKQPRHPHKAGGGSARTASTAPPCLRKIKALKRSTQEWQDPRAVHDLRGTRSERAPSWQDLRAVYSQTAVCGAFRMHGANILPKPAHFGCTAAICCQEGAFFPSEAPSGTHEAKKLPRIAARERIAAKYCHGRQPENAPRRYLATVGRRGTHFASILPSASARKRTAA